MNRLLCSSCILSPLRQFRLMLGAAALIVLAACGTTSPSPPSNQSVTLSLVAYSTPKTAYAVLVQAFQHSSAGRNVSFTYSFGASGQQAKAVVAGLPADVVNFSLEPDMQTVQKAGFVDSSWDTLAPQEGMVTDSTVVFVVRKGNPLHITGWSDLVRPGVTVVSPNPLSSGSARWNILAAYGAALALGDTPSATDTYMGDLLDHTVSQPSSASDALADFEAGTGDVLLDYEDDAIAAQRSGADLTYIEPAHTILIQNPIAVTTASSHPAQAKAFVSFLLSWNGQELWAKEGYRPVLPGAAAAAGVTFPPTDLFTITSLGGWSSVDTRFFATNGLVASWETHAGSAST